MWRNPEKQRKDRCAGYRPAQLTKKEVLAVRKEMRPMLRFAAARGNGCDRYGRATGGRDAVERTNDTGSENDDSVLIPGAAKAWCGFTQNLDGRIQKIDGLEPSLSKETNMQAVWGPEWKCGRLCAGVLRMEETHRLVLPFGRWQRTGFSLRSDWGGC